MGKNDLVVAFIKLLHTLLNLTAQNNEVMPAREEEEEREKEEEGDLRAEMRREMGDLRKEFLQMVREVKEGAKKKKGNIVCTESNVYSI